MRKCCTLIDKGKDLVLSMNWIFFRDILVLSLERTANICRKNDSITIQNAIYLWVRFGWFTGCKVLFSCYWGKTGRNMVARLHLVAASIGKHATSLKSCFFFISEILITTPAFICLNYKWNYQIQLPHGVYKSNPIFSSRWRKAMPIWKELKEN